MENVSIQKDYNDQFIRIVQVIRPFSYKLNVSSSRKICYRCTVWQEVLLLFGRRCYLSHLLGRVDCRCTVWHEVLLVPLFGKGQGLFCRCNAQYLTEDGHKRYHGRFTVYFWKSCIFFSLYFHKSSNVSKYFSGVRTSTSCTLLKYYN